MINKLTSVFDSNNKQIKKTEPTLKKIRDLEKQVSQMSIDQIKKRVSEMKADLAKNKAEIPEDSKRSLRKVERTKGLPSYEIEIQEKLRNYLPEVFAFVNEIYKRKMGFGYHDVQLQAGIVLADGQRLVEMKTGEGKTMTFQLPLALYAIAGRGAHLATVNDYLAKIGAEYAGHILSDLGISVGVITPQESYKFITDEEVKSLKGEESYGERKKQRMQIDNMTGLNLLSCTKKQAYECDITYGTNNEFGFDYLRDNMASDLSRVSQRELYFCIIDEADSILIDEARTPLIISATPSDSDTEKYVRFASAVRDLIEDVDYTVDHKDRAVTLTEEGIKKVESILEVPNLWDDYSMAYHLENALKAKALFKKDDEYLLRNGEVLIVDEFTGRVMKGRRYSEGLHQAIEAKEGVEIKQESKTYATITFQNFFRMYKILCGGSGTVLTEAEEFFKIYGLESMEIPTNKPTIRADHQDRIFKNQTAKFRAVAADIKERYEKGQPVLIGTVSVEKSELLSRLLDEQGIPHEVLNAKYHEQEARIVALAGRKGAVTVATNMAGRGTDIVIGGGSRGDDAWKEVVELGGLYVIGTERHDSRRIDNQLRGRTGRQGEPGETRFYVSLDDEIMRVLGGEVMSRILGMVRMDEDMPIELKLISKQIETAQKRIEGMNFDSRKRVVEYDDVMNQHREVFYSKRFSFLNRVENSLGRFKDDAKFLDLNLEENKDLRSNYESKVIEAQNNIKSEIEDIVMEEAAKIVTLNSQGKLSDKDIEELTKDFLTLIPEDYLSGILETSESEVSEKIAESLKGKKFIDIQNYLLDLVNKAFIQRLSEFRSDLYPLSKQLVLQQMDFKWVDHLEIMTDIRHGIGLQGYAQKDPLVEYKNKAFGVFESLIRNINSEIARSLFRIQKVARQEQPVNISTNEEEIEDILVGDRESIVSGGNNKLKSIIQDLEKNRQSTEATAKGNLSEGNATIKKGVKEFGRNDKVSVKYSDGKIVKDVKYKKVEDDVKSGKASILG